LPQEFYGAPLILLVVLIFISKTPIDTYLNRINRIIITKSIKIKKSFLLD